MDYNQLRKDFKKILNSVNKAEIAKWLAEDQERLDLEQMSARLDETLKNENFELFKHRRSAKSTNNDEYVLCAAVWYKDEEPLCDIEADAFGFNCYNLHSGVVVAGWRHANCMRTYSFLTGKPSRNEVQGFITNYNRFIDRKEAFQLACKTGQVRIVETADGREFYSEQGRIFGSRLFSEDLYLPDTNYRKIWEESKHQQQPIMV